MRSLFVSAGILTLSLLGAWNQWQTEPNQISDNEVMVLDGKPEHIQSIEWESEQMKTIISSKKDDFGAYLWVQYTDKKITDAPQTKEFKGGVKAERLLEDLAPLIGVRKIQDMDDQLEKIGLDASTTQLSLHKTNGQASFLIGDEAFGTKDFYIQDKMSKEIFLIDDKKIRSLINARTALLDRSLFEKKPEEALSLKLMWEGKELPLSHINPQDKDSAKWVRTNAPEADNTQLETWLGKIFKLSVSRYPVEKDSNITTSAAIILKISWGSGKDETLALYKQDDGWWGKSEHTRTMVKITGRSLDALYEDIPALFTQKNSE